MPSLKSRLIIFGIQHNHIFKGRLKRDVITRETSMVELRKQFEEGAKKFGAMPPDILATPVGVPDLPEGLSAEWIRLTANAASLCWHPCFRRPLRPGMRQLRTSRNA